MKKIRKQFKTPNGNKNDNFDPKFRQILKSTMNF